MVRSKPKTRLGRPLKGPFEVVQGGSSAQDTRVLRIREPGSGKVKKVHISNVQKLPKPGADPITPKLPAAGSADPEFVIPEEGEMIIYEACVGPEASPWGWILGKVQGVDVTEGIATVWVWSTPYRNPKRTMKPAWFHPDRLNTSSFEKHSHKDLSPQGYQRWLDDTVTFDRIWIRAVVLRKSCVSPSDLREVRRRVLAFNRHKGKQPT